VCEDAAVTERPQHIVRVAREGETAYALLAEDRLEFLDAAPWCGGRPTGRSEAEAGWLRLAPAEPTKIVCVGLNYRAHVAESATVIPGGGETPSEPLIFLKPPSALLGPGQPIVYPRGVTRLDPEAEMAIVIGRRARHVPAGSAADYVAGHTAFNDVSARNYQRQDGQWTRAKGFDTFAPLGPSLVLGLPSGACRVECRVNGERRQQGNTSDLLFPVPALIAHISAIMTLEPGDVIATGTPAGVAPVECGDVIEIEVEGVGVLRNPVVAAS
jgi:2-keto-4-pentenoate hydratase/2-oxohepta-3-ene-1,7-dioic acid hydratase in catechol pathway